MLVYGDATRLAGPHAMLAEIVGVLGDIARMGPGLARHAALVGAFIRAGELVQGLDDAAFERCGCDAPGEDRAGGFLLALAHAVRLSWCSGFAQFPPLPTAPAQKNWPEVISARAAEGFAHYAVYPEAYLLAASESQLPATTNVIGLRSIGLPLAAMVAAGLGAAVPIGLRPVGHPFARRLVLCPQTRAALLKADRFAVVDEGPGLSGSSFGAVADLLEDAGVAPAALSFFPSHAGPPGAQASPRHRARWSVAKRHVVDADTLILRAPRPAHRLQNWAADLTGAPLSGQEDLSGGAWRRLRADEPAWPPANPAQERRKFLLRAERGTWLLKFAGLGAQGARKLHLASALAEAGHVPKPAGVRHGFLVEEWHGEAVGLDQSPDPPSNMVESVGAYLARRVDFAAGSDEGADLPALLEMACANTAQALGEAAARALRRRLGGASGRRVRRVAVDGRMHRWEWLRLPDGSLLKTDAVDHHAAHDLVGCQDIAWDIAGAVVELGLDAETLCRSVGQAGGGEVDLALLDFYRFCYPAFQLGLWTMAAQSLAGWPQEAARAAAQAEGYAARLRRLLVRPPVMI